MILNSGSFAIFDWYETSITFPEDTSFKYGTKSFEGSTIIITKKGQEINLNKIQKWASDPRFEFTSYFRYTIFDFDEAFPEKKILIHNSASFIDYAKYIHENYLAGLDEIDVNIVEARGGYQLVATTLRKGIATKIKKRIDTKITPDKQIPQILDYFKKKCPKIPSENIDIYKCSSYLNSILSNSTRELKIYINDWVKNEKKYSDNLKVPPELISDLDHIKSITLKRSKVSNKILGIISLSGIGMEIEEDDSGITIESKTCFSESVIAAMKGRNFSDVINLPWAHLLTVRSAKIGEIKSSWSKIKGTVIRAYGDMEPFEIKGEFNIPEEEIKLRMREMINSGLMKTYDVNCERIFNQMSLSTVYGVIVLTMLCGRIPVDIFGYPDWEIGRNGNRLRVENCPAQNLDDFLIKRGAFHEGCLT